MDVQYNFHLRVILAPCDHPWADGMGVRRPIPGNIRALEDGKFSIRFSQPEIDRETRLFVRSRIPSSEVLVSNRKFLTNRRYDAMCSCTVAWVTDFPDQDKHLIFLNRRNRLEGTKPEMTGSEPNDPQGT